MKLLRRAFPVACVIVLCATPQAAVKEHASSETALVKAKAGLLKSSKSDRVLHLYRVGLCAMRAGDWTLAKSTFDEAIKSFDAMYGSSPEARRARSVFHPESSKTFMGEPYERIMAYLYRSVLFLMDGEMDNARACLSSAALQDDDPEGGKFKCDWVLVNYLDALLGARLGVSDSDIPLAQARKNSLADLPPLSTPFNVLVVAEFGKAPIKYATGKYKEQLRFKPGGADVSFAAVVHAESVLLVPYVDDLAYQSMTQGGRLIDFILKGKAHFKSEASSWKDAGYSDFLNSSRAGSSETDVLAGALGLVIGTVAHVVEAASNPAADTRTWDNLPGYLGFRLLRLPPGEQTLQVQFLDQNGRVIPGDSLVTTIQAPGSNQLAVVYASEFSVNKAAPPTDFTQPRKTDSLTGQVHAYWRRFYAKSAAQLLENGKVEDAAKALASAVSWKLAQADDVENRVRADVIARESELKKEADQRRELQLERKRDGEKALAEGNTVLRIRHRGSGSLRSLSLDDQPLPTSGDVLFDRAVKPDVYGIRITNRQGQSDVHYVELKKGDNIELELVEGSRLLGTVTIIQDGKKSVFFE